MRLPPSGVACVAIARRLEAEPDRVLARARQTLARMEKVATGASQTLREWAVLLARPVPALVEALRDPSPWARELRHQTPFAGVLSARERAEVYRAFRRAEDLRR